MKTRAIASGISILALALGAAGCAKEDTSTTTESGIKVVEKGALTICTHLPYEPFEYTEGGKTVGFDPDVLKIAADANDLEPRSSTSPGRPSSPVRRSTPASATSPPAP